MTYQVLARKYRPSRFEDVVGQEPVVRTLVNALATGRVHHAYVFSGIRGVGKTTTARLLARALNCAAGPTPQPCGTCPACTEIAAGQSLDSIEIDAASNRGIDEMKGLIQNAQYAPSRDRHKVFIVDEFHMLTKEAFNALLKTLEEPPPHVVFILATTELEKVPATILSRCLLLAFRPVPAEVVRQQLLDMASREGVQLDPGAADLVVRKAGGSLRDAQSTLDRVIALAGSTVSREAAAEVLGVVDVRVLREFLSAVMAGRAADAVRIVAHVASSGSDLHGFLDDLLGEARQALLARLLPDAAQVAGIDEADVAELVALAEGRSDEDLHRIVDRLLEAGPRLRQAAEPRFFLEALAVRLAHLVHLEPLADLARRIAAGPAAVPVRPGDGSPPASGPRPGASAPAAPRAGGAPRSAAPAPRAADPPTGGPGWRDRVARLQAQPPPADDDEDAMAPRPPRAEPPPPRPEPAASPIERFRAGLVPRLRGHVDLGLVRGEGDGVAILLPGDQQAALRQLEEHRFHVMAAAAEAFGRPVPVRVALAEGAVVAPLRAGDVEGAEHAARRRLAMAEAAPAVQALLARFDGRITGVAGTPPR